MTVAIRLWSDRVAEVLSICAGLGVKRWHTIETLGTPQNNGHHSARALALLFSIHPNPSMNLVKAVLFHDTAERQVGDMPATARRLFPRLAQEYEQAEEVFFNNHFMINGAFIELSADDFQWLKAVDILELLLFCDDQTMLGNSHFAIIKERAIGYMKSNAETPLEALDFLNRYEPQSFA